MTTTAATAKSRISPTEVIVLGLIVLCSAAILLPILPASRETSRANLCRFNLRKIDLTTRLYIDDHQRIPDTSTWPVELLPQLLDANTSGRLQLGMAIFEMPRPWVLTCPSHPNATEKVPAKQTNLYTFVIDRDQRLPQNQMKWHYRDRARETAPEETQPWYIGVELNPEAAEDQLAKQGPHQGRFLESRGDGTVDFATDLE